MMHVRTDSPSEIGIRRRKAHTKSRRGCGNCKLRHTKCDEAKPSCKKCLSFGVSCSYGHRTTPGEGILQPSMGGMFHLDVLPSPPLRGTILGAINSSLAGANLSHGDYPFDYLTINDIDVLSRFQTRTIPTLETPHIRGLYQTEIITLAGQHPFLMHIALGFTLMHDRHLVSSPPRPPSAAELAHFARGTALFNLKLSGPLTPSEKDAIWGAATLLGSSTLARIEAVSPEQAWPLQELHENDLDWLRMYDGKREIWRITDPTRPDCCLRRLGEEVEMFRQTMSITEPGLKQLPGELCRLLSLHDQGNHLPNPYRIPANILNNLMAMESSKTSILAFLSFLNLMQADFRKLLVHKDPYALILLAYWLAEFSQYHACGIDHLDTILKHPRKICGLASSQNLKEYA
ncbi:hypothetical protein BX600DRAFT_549606 [Xylariales sp. PMI_506]|nr:hypothetical protein BX600DRAFT_549606 [Xylariales sp. PMI_506]